MFRAAFTSFALVLITGSASGAAAPSSAQALSTRECALAQEAISGMTAARPIPWTLLATPGRPRNSVQSSLPKSFFREMAGAYVNAQRPVWWYADGWRGDPPSPTLVAAFQRKPDRTQGPACPHLRDWLTTKRIGYGYPPPHEPMGRNPIGALFLDLPTISGDGAEALISIGYVAGALDGGTFVQHLRRGSDGRWRLVGGKTTSVA